MENLRPIYATVSGACFIAITQIVTRENVNAAHFIALACFVTAMPFCALVAAVARLEHLQQGSFLSKLVSHLSGNALFVFWLGVAAMTFSFGWLIGLLFVIPSLIAWAIAHVTLSKSNSN
jgi:hypothetical protein